MCFDKVIFTTMKRYIQPRKNQGKYKVSPKRHQYAKIKRSMLNKVVEALMKQTKQNTADQFSMMKTKCSVILCPNPILN